MLLAAGARARPDAGTLGAREDLVETWSYEVRYLDWNGRELTSGVTGMEVPLEALLEDLGKQGWELVSLAVVSPSAGAVAVFKKPK